MTILDFAKVYVGLGYSPVPIAINGSKRPTVRWQTYQKRIADADGGELMRLFPVTRTGTPLRGVALVHGAISGNSEVLDFDRADFYDMWSERCIDGGFGEVLLDLVHVRTPTGGRHVYYRCTEPVEGNQKLAFTLLDIPEHAERGKRTNGSSFARWDGDEYPVVTVKDPSSGNGIEKAETVAIETRGEGGYTLAPGSPAACHPSGGEYRCIGGTTFWQAVHGKSGVIKPNSYLITPDVRDALLSIARALCQKPPLEVRPLKTATLTRRPYDTIKPGDDYNERATQEEILELLTSAGWTVTGQSGRVIQLARPGKSKGMSGTLGYDAANVFHSFTTNGDMPAEGSGSGKAYAPFSVYAKIRHGGDFGAAARDLGERGYGDARSTAQVRRDAMLGRNRSFSPGEGFPK